MFLKIFLFDTCVIKYIISFSLSFFFYIYVICKSKFLEKNEVLSLMFKSYD